jgi:MFS family permease
MDKARRQRRAMNELLPNQEERIASDTKKYDLRRNLFNGIVEASYYSSVLLVAIRHFGASDNAKSLIAGGSCLGFLLTPIFLLLVGKYRLPVSRICALLVVGTGTGILLSATANSAWVYTGWVLIACVLAGQVPSLMVHVYSRNYRPGERGRKISGNLMLSAVVGAITALIIGRLLDDDLNHFRPIAVVMFLFCLCTAFYHLKIPSAPLKPTAGGLSKDLRHALKDRLFSWMLTGWMLMGIGNLVTIPLRVEYLANPAYGIDASNTIVLSITLIIPLVARVISTPVWGLVFDRFNLAFVRIAINLFFLVGLFIYFQTQNLIFLCLASALIGWATGGGTMAWTLWVTKIAPSGRESSYMSIHSFFTGVRGVPAPFVGYWIITTLGPSQVGWTSVILIGASSLIFLALSRDQRLKASIS